jgi:hypothetical protein
MRDDAVLAAVGAARGRDDDHLACSALVRLPVSLQQQGIVVGEEGAEFIRPAREREKDVGHEARLGLDVQDAFAFMSSRQVR